MSALPREFLAYKARLLEYRARHEKPEQIEIVYPTHKLLYYPDGERTFGCMLDKAGRFRMYIPKVTMN